MRRNLFAIKKNTHAKQNTKTETKGNKKWLSQLKQELKTIKQ